MYYALNEDNSIRKIDDVREWAKSFELKDRRVARDDFNEHFVSTVFLGVDHAFGDGPPLLFESMVFKLGDWGDIESRRYSTWEQALAGHRELVEKWREQTAKSI